MGSVEREWEFTTSRFRGRNRRHRAAVHLLEAGVEVNVIRARLGHVSLDTTNRYAEISRHTAATQLLMNGCPVGHIKEILGHERLETTCRYYLGLDRRAAKAAHQRPPLGRWFVQRRSRDVRGAFLHVHRRNRDRLIHRLRTEVKRDL